MTLKEQFLHQQDELLKVAGMLESDGDISIDDLIEYAEAAERLTDKIKSLI